MEQVVTDVRDFLCKHTPWGEQKPLGMPSLIIVGGSQTADGGAHKMADSDTDVLVFYDHVNHPTSFQFRPLRRQSYYDLMVRDKATFAYDVEQGLQDGRGTLLHIAAHGKIIYDAWGTGSSFQSHIKDIHRQGPLTINRQDMEGELSSLITNFDHLKQGHESYVACVAALCNRIGRLALRFNGDWTSNGKIAGRFLQQKMPAFAQPLCLAFMQAVFHANQAPLDDLAFTRLRQIFDAADLIKQRGVAQLRAPYPFVENPRDLADSTTSARCNIDSFAHYLRGSAGVEAQRAAATWAQIKLSTIFSPLTRERAAKKPMEYFMALGRAIGGAADIFVTLDGCQRPSDMTLVERIQYLFRHETIFAQSYLQRGFLEAVAGEPEGLQELKKSLSQNIEGISLIALLDRPSPSHHRSSFPNLIA